jgi:hypothetical protein
LHLTLRERLAFRQTVVAADRRFKAERPLSRIRLFWLRRYSCFLATIFLAISIAPPAFADGPQKPDDAFLIYGIDIRLSSATQSWSGNAIYLGKGLIISAAHVVGRAATTKIMILFGAQEYPARIVKEGSFDGIDLTLLSIEERSLPFRLRLRLNPICTQPTFSGQQVLTVDRERTTRSKILAPERLPVTTRRFSTVIADVAGTGMSGSGVFDPEHHCLAGIISRKISQTRTRIDTGKVETRDIGKYFVPASDIRQFLPAELMP